MKKVILTAILAVLVVTGVAFSEYFPDVIVTSPDGIWTDTRAYGTLSAAITDIGSSVRDVYVARTETLTTLTVPSNVSLHFFGSGSIANSGQLTINTKNISAPNRQIFTGTGNIDFAAGTVLKSGWFQNIESAFALTTNDTVTLIVSKPQSITANFSPGNDVNLRWESPGNILTVNAGVTVGNLKNIEAGNYQIFAGSGDFDFLDGTRLKLDWFNRLRSVLTWVETESVTIVISGENTIDYTSTVTENEILDFVSENGSFTGIGTLAIHSPENIIATPRQNIFGSVIVSFANAGKVFANWFYSTSWSTAFQTAIDSCTSGYGVVTAASGTYDLGTTGIGWSHPNAHLDLYDVVLTYSGADAAIWVNDTGAAVGTEEFLIEGGTISGTGVYGIKLGNITGPTTYSAVGTIRDTKISMSSGTGIYCQSAQVVNLDSVWIDSCDIGFHSPNNAGFFNTFTSMSGKTRITNCTNEGVLLEQGWGISFDNVQIEGNGKEGVKIERDAGGMHTVTFDGCWIEQNNYGRGTGPYYQVLVENIQTGSLIDYFSIRDTTFAVHGTGNRNIGVFGRVNQLIMSNLRHEEAGGPSTTHGTVGLVGEYCQIIIEGSELYNYWEFAETKAFSSGGTTPIVVGDTITGDISGSTGDVVGVTVSGGTWAGGDASGFLYIVNKSAAFVAEDLGVLAVDQATITGDFNPSLHIWRASEIQTITSPEQDFSATAGTYYFHTQYLNAIILNLYTVYTEGSGLGHAASAIKVGKVNNSDGINDDDYYFTGLLSNSMPIGRFDQRTLLNNDLDAEDIVSFYCDNGVAAAGKMAVVIEYVLDY